jgi:hypothetical protein
MKQLSDMSLFELATEMNSLLREIDNLELRYNMVVNEIKSRNDKLKNDPNLEPKVLRKEIKDGNKTNKR